MFVFCGLITEAYYVHCLGGVDWLGGVHEEQGRQPAGGLVQHCGCTEWLCQLEPVTAGVARELPQFKLQVSLVQKFKIQFWVMTLKNWTQGTLQPSNEGGCTERLLNLLTQQVGRMGGGGLHSLRGLLRLGAWCWLASGLRGSMWCRAPLQTEAVLKCKTNFDWTSYSWWSSRTSGRQFVPGHRWKGRSLLKCFNVYLKCILFGRRGRI